MLINFCGCHLFRRTAWAYNNSIGGMSMQFITATKIMRSNYLQWLFLCYILIDVFLMFTRRAAKRLCAGLKIEMVEPIHYNFIELWCD